MQIHYPHYTDPKNKPTVIRKWTERRFTKNPIKGSTVQEKEYLGTFVEYTYVNSKKKLVHVSELIVRVQWL